MKRLLFGIIATISVLVLFSCEKEEKEDVTPPSNKDFYYVKYEISGSVYFYIDEVTYNTENGVNSKKFAAARSFEEICGPVNKGFSAQIKITKHRGSPSPNATKISISKNNGPFVTKASGSESASYTIDF